MGVDILVGWEGKPVLRREGVSHAVSRGRAFYAEERSSAKALRQKHTRHV